MKEELLEVVKQSSTVARTEFTRVKDRLTKEWFTQKLLDLYFKCPTKIQYALSRYVIKAVVNKKHSKLKDLIKH